MNREPSLAFASLRLTFLGLQEALRLRKGFAHQQCHHKSSLISLGFGNLGGVCFFTPAPNLPHPRNLQQTARTRWLAAYFKGFRWASTAKPHPHPHTHTHTQQFSSPSITGMISPKPCSPKPLNSRPSRPYEHSEPTSLTSESKGLDANQLNLLVKAADRPDAADEAVKDSRFSVHERGLGIRAWCSSMALQQGFKWI